MYSPVSPGKPVQTSAVGSWLREAALTASASGVVVLFCLSLLLLDRNFFWIDDYQCGALPAYSEMNRAWRSGELPLLSRSTWRGGAIAAEFPTGVFSPSLNAGILLVFGLNLPLPLAAATLSILHLAILAAGAFRLARRSGLSPDLAMLVALLASLNGWIIFWGARNWLVCLVSFAWLPWFWWALERARAGLGGWLAFAPAGVFLYLIITAGWPFTIAMAALVTVWVMLRTYADRRRLRALWPAPAAWAVGMALSAPAWLMFLEFMPYTDRGHNGSFMWTNTSMVVPLDSLLGLILPNVVRLWNVYGAAQDHVSVELAGGLAPVVILAACLWWGGRGLLRALPWEWALCGLGLALITCPSLAKLPHSFRWLPFFFLALGLLAAHCLARARALRAVAAPRGAAPAGVGAARKLPNLGLVAAFLLLGVWGLEVLYIPWIDTSLIASGASLVVLAVVWARVEDRFPAASPLRAWAPCAMVLASCWIACASCRNAIDVPTWKLGEQAPEAGPLEPGVRYMSIHTYEDAFDFQVTRRTARSAGLGEELYIGSIAGLAGLDFVNGYSPTRPLGMQEVFNWDIHGCFSLPDDADRILSSEVGPNGLLQRMGVDGLVVSDRFESFTPTLVSYGWKETAKVRGGRVFRRIGPPSPHARAVVAADFVDDWNAAVIKMLRHGSAPTPSLVTDAPRHTAARGRYVPPAQIAVGAEYSLPTPLTPMEQLPLVPAQVTVVEEGRNSMTVDVASAPGDGEVLVTFARPWFPGYHATCDGKPVAVQMYDLFLPAVRLPAGTNGRVVLSYWPTSLSAGFWLAGTTAAALALAVAATAVRRLLRRRAVPKTMVRAAVAAIAPVPEQMLV